MTELYKVAGHVFAFSFSDGDNIWSALDQYSPFAVPSGSPVFTLTSEGTIPGETPELVYDPEIEPGETLIRLYRTGDGWMAEMAPVPSRPITARLWMNAEFTTGRIEMLSMALHDKLFSVNNSAMLMFAFATAGLGTLEMHASMVSNSGRAFLFVAPSGTGKSTHSRQWLKYIEGSELMNDDNPVVRVWPDGRVIAYGSPWSGKTPCYRNVEAPVGAVVKIRRCKDNIATRLGTLESYVELYSSSSGLKFHEDMADKMHETLEQVVTNIPCYVLDCRPDEEAARVCFEAVCK